MTGYHVPPELAVYRVEVRSDEADPWDRPHPVVAGWAAAVTQLHEALEVALEGVDDDPDAMARDCAALLGEIERGSFDGWTPRASSGRYARITPAGITPGDPMAAWLRFLLVRDSSGRGTATIRTRSGRTVHGTVTWDGFDTDTTAVLSGGDLVVLRSAEIESFAWTAATASAA